MLCVCCVFSTFAKDGASFSEVIVNEPYIEALKQQITFDLQSEALYLGIDPYDNIIEKGLDRQILEDISEEYFSSLYENALIGKPPECKNYPKEKFLPSIEAFITDFEKHHNITINNGQAELFSEEFAKSVDASIRVFPKKMVDMIYKPIKLYHYAAVSALPGLIIFLVAVTAIVGSILLRGKKHISNEFYRAFVPVWLATCTFFIPLLFISIYNLPARLVLAKNTFKICIDTLCYRLLDGAFIPSFLLFFIATAGLIYGIVAKSQKIKEKTHTS